jgi:hypothetical protein
MRITALTILGMNGVAFLKTIYDFIDDLVDKVKKLSSCNDQTQILINRIIESKAYIKKLEELDLINIDNFDKKISDFKDKIQEISSFIDEFSTKTNIVMMFLQINDFEEKMNAFNSELTNLLLNLNFAFTTANQRNIAAEQQAREKDIAQLKQKMMEAVSDNKEIRRELNQIYQKNNLAGTARKMLGEIFKNQNIIKKLENDLNDLQTKTDGIKNENKEIKSEQTKIRDDLIEVMDTYQDTIEMNDIRNMGYNALEQNNAKKLAEFGERYFQKMDDIYNQNSEILGNQVVTLNKISLLQDIAADILSKTNTLIENVKDLKHDVHSLKIDLNELKQKELERFKVLTTQIYDVSQALFQMISLADKNNEYRFKALTAMLSQQFKDVLDGQVEIRQLLGKMQQRVIGLLTQHIKEERSFQDKIINLVLSLSNFIIETNYRDRLSNMRNQIQDSTTYFEGTVEPTSQSDIQRSIQKCYYWANDESVFPENNGGLLYKTFSSQNNHLYPILSEDLQVYFLRFLAEYLNSILLVSFTTSDNPVDSSKLINPYIFRETVYLYVGLQFKFPSAYQEPEIVLTITDQINNLYAKANNTIRFIHNLQLSQNLWPILFANYIEAFNKLYKIFENEISKHPINDKDSNSVGSFTSSSDDIINKYNEESSAARLQILKRYIKETNIERPKLGQPLPHDGCTEYQWTGNLKTCAKFMSEMPFPQSTIWNHQNNIFLVDRTYPQGDSSSDPIIALANAYINISAAAIAIEQLGLGQFYFETARYYIWQQVKVFDYEQEYKLCEYKPEQCNHYVPGEEVIARRWLGHQIVEDFIIKMTRTNQSTPVLKLISSSLSGEGSLLAFLNAHSNPFPFQRNYFHYMAILHSRYEGYKSCERNNNLNCMPPKKELITGSGYEKDRKITETKSIEIADCLLEVRDRSTSSLNRLYNNHSCKEVLMLEPIYVSALELGAVYTSEESEQVLPMGGGIVKSCQNQYEKWISSTLFPHNSFIPFPLDKFLQETQGTEDKFRNQVKIAYYPDIYRLSDEKHISKEHFKFDKVIKNGKKLLRNDHDVMIERNVKTPELSICSPNQYTHTPGYIAKPLRIETFDEISYATQEIDYYLAKERHQITLQLLETETDSLKDASDHLDFIRQIIINIATILGIKQEFLQRLGILSTADSNDSAQITLGKFLKTSKEIKETIRKCASQFQDCFFTHGKLQSISIALSNSAYLKQLNSLNWTNVSALSLKDSQQLYDSSLITNLQWLQTNLLILDDTYQNRNIATGLKQSDRIASSLTRIKIQQELLDKWLKQGQEVMKTLQILRDEKQKTSQQELSTTLSSLEATQKQLSQEADTVLNDSAENNSLKKQDNLKKEDINFKAPKKNNLKNSYDDSIRKLCANPEVNLEQLEIKLDSLTPDQLEITLNTGDIHNRPLYLAIQAERTDVVKLLLEYDAKVDKTEASSTLINFCNSAAIIKEMNALIDFYHYMQNQNLEGLAVGRVLALLDESTNKLSHWHDLENAVVFLGQTGVGKSVLIDILLGFKYSLTYSNKGIPYLKINGESPEKAKTSSSSRSQTTFPEIFPIDDQHLVDMPGFRDTRGEAWEIAGGLSAQLLPRIFKSLRMLVLICADSQDPRMEELRNSFDMLGNIINLNLNLLKHVRVIFNKALPGLIATGGQGVKNRLISLKDENPDLPATTRFVIDHLSVEQIIVFNVPPPEFKKEFLELLKLTPSHAFNDFNFSSYHRKANKFKKLLIKLDQYQQEVLSKLNQLKIFVVKSQKNVINTLMKDIDIQSFDKQIESEIKDLNTIQTSQKNLRFNLINFFNTLTTYIQDHYDLNVDETLLISNNLMQDIADYTERLKVVTYFLENILPIRNQLNMSFTSQIHEDSSTQCFNSDDQRVEPPACPQQPHPLQFYRHLLSIEENDFADTEILQVSSSSSRYDTSWLPWNLLAFLGRQLLHCWPLQFPLSNTEFIATRSANFIIEETSCTYNQTAQTYVKTESLPIVKFSILDQMIDISKTILAFPGKDTLMLLQIPFAALGRYRDRVRKLSMQEQTTLQGFKEQLDQWMKRIEHFSKALYRNEPQFATDSNQLLDKIKAELLPALEKGEAANLIIERLTRYMDYLEKRIIVAENWFSHSSGEIKENHDMPIANDIEDDTEFEWTSPPQAIGWINWFTKGISFWNNPAEATAPELTRLSYSGQKL